MRVERHAVAPQRGLGFRPADDVVPVVLVEVLPRLGDELMQVVQVARRRRGVVDRGWLVGAILHDEPSAWEAGGTSRHDAHPGDPSSTSRGFASYAQEAVTIGRSVIAEGERQDGDFRLPTLRQPRDAVEKQTPFLLVTLANHESGRGTFDLSGPLASVLIAHQPKHASQRQDRDRKRKKLQGVRGCKIEYQQLAPTTY